MLAHLVAFRKRPRAEKPAPWVLRCGLNVPLEDLSPARLEQTQEDLVFQPKSGFDRTVLPPRICCFGMSATHIRVPRCYRGLDDLGGVDEDELASGEPLECGLFRGELKPHQIEAAQKSLEELRKPPRHACILTLPCGFGKTVVALHIARQLGRRTLVCVHKQFLMDQWTERIQEFLPDATVGRIQGARVDVQGHAIVVAMIQSLASRAYPPEVLESFGLVILDEAHHMAAAVFSKIFFKLPCRHVLGLTATPDRKDGCGDILHLFMGPFSHVVRACDEQPKQSTAVDGAAGGDGGSPSPAATVRLVEYKSRKPVAGEVGAGLVQRLKTSLTRDRRRNGVLAGLCLEAARRGRFVICLSDRVDHVRELLALYEAGGGADGVLYIGGQRAQERREAEARGRAFFATNSLAREGLDIRRLDTLILSTPVGDVAQAVGRILRPCAEKQPPLVFDIVDDLCQQFVWQARARRLFFERCGFRFASSDEDGFGERASPQ